MSDKTMTFEQWQQEATELFGPDKSKWKFVCPGCGHVQSVQDYKDAGAPQGAIGFSCVGRYLEKSQDFFGAKPGKGPCNYAGGGLFGMNPVEVKNRDDSIRVFEFARQQVKF